MATEMILSIVIISISLVVAICILEALFRTTKAEETLDGYKRSQYPKTKHRSRMAQRKLVLSQQVKDLLARKIFIAVSPDLIRDKAIDEPIQEGIIHPRVWRWDAN